jgi:hypothetical protein
MKTSRYQLNQQGFGHVVLVVIILVVLGVISFAGWKIISGHKSPASGALSKAAIEAACKETDKNICKFKASWKIQKYYTIKSTSPTESADGHLVQSTYQAEGTDKFRLTTGGSSPYDVITIGKTTYTKASDGVWWKQTVKPEDTSKNKESFDFDNSSDSNSSESASTTTYKSLGKEACGSLTCYKYQVVDSSSMDTTEYIWFDTKDYQLRRIRNESKDGGVTESTFSYDKISITVPSPVKELGPNQYLVPGQSEPQTMPAAPSASDIQAMQDSFNNSADATDESQ